jgi:hypothetical protein
LHPRIRSSVIAGPPRSGETRQSITFRKMMDARVKPAHDEGETAMGSKEKRF